MGTQNREWWSKMKIIDNNLVFDYFGERFSVPLNKPWDIYTGETKPAPNYDDCIDKKIHNKIDYVFFHVTSKCNLECSYCFEKEKSVETADLSNIDGLINLIVNEQPKIFNIRFFGGEPFLEPELIEETINKIQKKTAELKLQTKVLYNIFTNATIVNNKLLDIIKKHEFAVFSSIDGCQTMHDKNRVFKNGKGSYETVRKNIKLLKDASEGRIIARCVFDVEQNNVTLIDVVNELLKEGIIIISIEFPWVSSESNLALDESRLNYVKKIIMNFAEEYVIRIEKKDLSYIGVAPFSRIIGFLLNEENFLTNRACEAGCSGISLSVEGDIYPCHVFVGKDEFKLGDIKNGIINHSLRQTFMDYSTDRVELCKDCPIKYLCIGNCPADAFLFNNDICNMNTYRCEIQKEIVKSSLYIYYRLKQDKVHKRAVRFYFNKLRDLYKYN